ncbi:uncharacterized protein G6M90_00g109450 [Metarhizium brunneum]|uniref:Uncharacterized protein n=1 Tax=Metarhizium brunneum TaxID=500148 RepID=A0A7D5YX40_9HYPO
MIPSAESCRLSSHHGETSAPTTQENQLGMFEKSLREKVHNQWERQCVPTTKCDKCQSQGHKVLQKCSICTWSICQECSKDSGLRKSEGPCHILDHNAVDWILKEDSTNAEKDSTNSWKKRTNAKKNTTHAKKTTTRRAKRVKTANKVEITLVAVTEEPQASDISGISGHAKGQILPHPLQGQAHKAIQTMPASYPPHRFPERNVDDEHEIVAGMPTQRQNSNSPYPDRQENPSTTKGFVPAQILLPNPSTYPYLPSLPPFSSGHSLPLQYTTTIGRAAHGLPREPWPSHTKFRQPLAIRHGSADSVQIWIPPFENRIGYGKQTRPEPGPPGPHETLHSVPREFVPTRVCEEEPSREQLAPECFTTPPNLTSQCQEYHETKPILGKRGRSTFTLLEPEVNLGVPYLRLALSLCGDTK